MGLLNLFTKAEPERKPSQAPAQPRAVFRSARFGGPVVVYDNFCAARAALEHPILQRCLRTIARAVQVVEFYAEPAEDDPASADVVRRINDLLASPNDEYTGAMLRFWMALSLAVYGKAPFKVSIGTFGLPNGIYPLDAEFLRAVANDRGRLDHFRYGMEGNQEIYPIRRKDRSNQGWAYNIMTPTLSGDLLSNKDTIVPLHALGGPAKVLNMLMQRTLATAAGAPNAKYIISCEEGLTQEQMDEIEETIESHETFGSESGEVMFIRGTKVEVHKLDSSLSDMHSKMPADDMTRMIFGAWGIPVALAGLGAADAAKYASNYTESRSAFYFDTIAPEYLTPIADGLTKGVAPPGVVIKYDIDSIPAILESRIKAMDGLKDVNFLSADEKRGLFGFKPRGGKSDE